MKLYVAITADRHTAPEPNVFTTAEAAIEFARNEALANARSEADIEEEPVEGRLFHARYSDEGDSVWVVQKELDTPTH